MSSYSRLRKIFIATACIALLVVSAPFALLLTLKGASAWTPHCPLSHQFVPDLQCRITDVRGNDFLMEHYDLDINRGILSIHHHGALHSVDHWYKYPKSKTYHANLEENEFKFDPSNRNVILVNGEPVPLFETSKDDFLPLEPVM